LWNAKKRKTKKSTGSVRGLEEEKAGNTILQKEGRKSCLEGPNVDVPQQADRGAPFARGGGLNMSTSRGYLKGSKKNPANTRRPERNRVVGETLWGSPILNLSVKHYPQEDGTIEKT